MLIILALSACQAAPTPTPPAATPTPRPTAAQTAAPARTATITPLPTFTLEPLLGPPGDFAPLDDFSADQPAQDAPPQTFRAPTRQPTGSAAINPTQPIIRFTQGPTATEDPDRDYPLTHDIAGVTGHQQAFPLGCEAAAAVDWARFYDVEINEDEFQESLPVSDNPDKGFVGEVTGRWGQIPPNDYGVHAGPVADLLYDVYELPAVSYSGYTIEDLKRSIANDHPVIAWVIGNVTSGAPKEYTDEDGDVSVVAAFEHVVIVTGYNDNNGTLRYLNNGRSYTVPQETFLNSWGVLDNMVVVYEE